MSAGRHRRRVQPEKQIADIEGLVAQRYDAIVAQLDGGAADPEGHARGDRGRRGRGARQYWRQFRWQDRQGLSRHRHRRPESNMGEEQAAEGWSRRWRAKACNIIMLAERRAVR